eukprot:TRINITY_DN26957_c0_g1_i1.p1 TRINITY_DN26957_c0_g1~~TRINITY_DN26957_c0_g1_i1.p1  ORF type:complete len:236 (-),score=71.53 TRINITY_DN26957_c0_g1_i1:35-742(-)
MFGFDCSSSCGKADTPAAGIVKVSSALLEDMRQESQEQARVADEAELRRREAAKAAAREAERQADAEWLSFEHQAEDFELRRRREGEEAARREAEVAAVVAAAARQWQEKEQRRPAGEAEMRKAAVSSFLKDYGFTDVRSAKRNLVRSTYPLHKAAKLGCGALVAMLLQEGADPAQRDSWGQTAAEVAQQYNKGISHAVVLRELQSFSSESESSHETKAVLCSGGFVRTARMAGA